MITAKTIQQAADKQLGNSIADQEDGYRGLHLDTAGMKRFPHQRHGRKVYIDGKAG